MFLFKKLIFIMVIIISIFYLSACKAIKTEIENNETEDRRLGDDMVVVSKLKTTKSGKTYLEVMGNPFVLVGGQIRIDGLTNRGTDDKKPPSLSVGILDKEGIERYIHSAKDFGLNVVQLPIDWKDLEPKIDEYDFSFLDMLMELCNKYDIKMELLWFSTNMCGDSHSFHIPDYIWKDLENYPKMDAKYEDSWQKEVWNWMYGYIGYLVLDNELLMHREEKMLTNMMNHIYVWNNLNGQKYPVISVQVHNESDGMLRWRVDQRELKLDGDLISKERIWKMTLNALDNAGKAIKKSKYKVVTRANMTVSLNTNNFPQASFASPLDVLALDGIDIIGDDPYVEEPKQIKDSILSYSKNGNYPHIAENMGNYPSTPSLMLAAYATGGGYNIYDFVTPEFFIWMNSYYNSSYQMDQGILNPDFSEKSHSKLTKSIVNGIVSAGPIVSLVDKENFAAFNIQSKIPKENHEQIINTNHLRLTFKTTNKALAYAIEYNDNLLVYSTDKIEIKVENANISPFSSIGYYNNAGSLIVLDKVYLSGYFLSIEGGKLYTFNILSTNGLLESTTMDNI